MSEQQNHSAFEDAWQKAFADAEVPPSKGLWKKIGNELAEKKHKRRTLGFFLRYTVAACLLLGLVRIGIDVLDALPPKGGEEALDALKKAPEKSLQAQSSEGTSVTAKVSPAPTSSLPPSLASDNITAAVSTVLVLPVWSPATAKLGATQQQYRESKGIQGKMLIADGRQLGTIDEKPYDVDQEPRKTDENEPARSKLSSTNTLIPSAKEGIALLEPHRLTLHSRMLFLPRRLPWLESYMSMEEPQVSATLPAKFSRWQVEGGFAPGSFQPGYRVQQSQPVTTALANKTETTALSSSPGNVRSDGTPRKIGDDLENNTRAALSYQFGLQAGYSLTKNLSVHTGIHYLYQNSEVNTDQYVVSYPQSTKEPLIINLVTQEAAPAYTSDELLPSPVSRPPSNDKPILALNNTFQYLSFPLLCQYRFLNRRFSLVLGAGISTDVFLQNTISSHEEDVKTYRLNFENSKIYRSYFLSGLLNLRAEYRLHSRYYLFLEPRVKQGLGSATYSDNLKSRPRTLGLGTGLRITF